MKKSKVVADRPNKLSIKKQDQVMILAGREAGKKGKVLKVFPKTQRVIVEGINFIKKAQRPSQRNQKGGIIEKEAPLHISNLILVCSRCGERTRAGRSILSDGRRVRVCKKCSEVLDK
jgi:large subunit ribosomal protein L24